MPYYKPRDKRMSHHHREIFPYSLWSLLTPHVPLVWNLNWQLFFFKNKCLSHCSETEINNFPCRAYLSNIFVTLSFRWSPKFVSTVVSLESRKPSAPNPSNVMMLKSSRSSVWISSHTLQCLSMELKPLRSMEKQRLAHLTLLSCSIALPSS